MDRAFRFVSCALVPVMDAVMDAVIPVRAIGMRSVEPEPEPEPEPDLSPI